MASWCRFVAAAVLSSIASTGCSFALSSPDPNRPRTVAPECDTGKGLVGLDGLIGGSFAIASLGLLGADEGAGAAITGLIGVAFIASAIRGNSAVNECRQAMAEYRAPDVDRAIDQQQVANRPPPPVRAQPATVMQPPQPGDPYGDEPPYQAPHVNPVIPSPPAAVAKPVRPAPPPPPAPEQPPEEPSDWKDFWTEVP